MRPSRRKKNKVDSHCSSLARSPEVFFILHPLPDRDDLCHYNADSGGEEINVARVPLRLLQSGRAIELLCGEIGHR